MAAINVRSRLAWISPASLAPYRSDNAQFEALARAHTFSRLRPGIVRHDRDTKFGLVSDTVSELEITAMSSAIPCD